MIRRCACVIAAIAYFSARVALGQDAGGAGGSHETGETAKPELMTPEKPEQPPLGSNPLSRIPLNSLSATRERPLFSASRRPPAPAPAPPRSIAKPSPPAEPERPPFTLQGTAIGKPRAIALVLDQTAKGSVRLHVGDAAEGWRLRSVDRRAVTLEKDGRIVVLSLPPPGAAPSSPTGLASGQTDQPNVRDDGRPRAKAGANWISVAHVLY